MVKRKKAPRSSAGSAAAAAADAAGQSGADSARPVRRKRRPRRAAAATRAEAAEVKEDSDDSEDDEEDDDEDDDEDDAAAANAGEEELEIDFDFRDPDELDFHAVKDLLKSGTWEFAADLNFTELADSVVGQGNIGTIIKSSSPLAEDDDDETSCGLLTALNLRQFKHLGWVKTVEEALMARARKHGSTEVASKLDALLQRQGKDAEVGLLFSERFLNLPPDLIPLLHKALKEDIDWSCTTPECPADERPFYFFTHFLLALKCTPAGAASSAPSKKRRKSGSPSGGADGEEKATFGGMVFQQEEMVSYVKRADFWFSFPVAATAVQKKGAKAPEHRAVLSMTRKAFEQAVGEMHSAAKAAARAAKKS